MFVQNFIATHPIVVEIFQCGPKWQTDQQTLLSLETAASVAKNKDYRKARKKNVLQIEITSDLVNHLTAPQIYLVTPSRDSFSHSVCTNIHYKKIGYTSCCLLYNIILYKKQKMGVHKASHFCASMCVIPALHAHQCVFRSVSYSLTVSAVLCPSGLWLL